jgi:hypothetical protein
VWQWDKRPRRGRRNGRCFTSSRELVGERAPSPFGVVGERAQRTQACLGRRAFGCRCKFHALELRTPALELEPDTPQRGREQEPTRAERPDARPFRSTPCLAGAELGLPPRLRLGELRRVPCPDFEPRSFEFRLFDAFEPRVVFETPACFGLKALALFGGVARTFGGTRALGFGFGFERRGTPCFGELVLPFDAFALEDGEILQREQQR